MAIMSLPHQKYLKKHSSTKLIHELQGVSIESIRLYEVGCSYNTYSGRLENGQAIHIERAEVKRDDFQDSAQSTATDFIYESNTVKNFKCKCWVATITFCSQLVVARSLEINEGELNTLGKESNIVVLGSRGVSNGSTRLAGKAFRRGKKWMQYRILTSVERDKMTTN